MTAAELPESRSTPSTEHNAPTGRWSDWLRRTQLLPGTPFLLSPTFDYNTDLNGFFRTAAMTSMAATTQVGWLGDFLNRHTTPATGPSVAQPNTVEQH
ncbi:hypothetical protein CH299_28970 [Rhodococcus sp. 14-2686-1-2]|nr:hypothetical protein CH301_28455 [Rhodococcus sp. 15-1189-1-1a]OZF08195.1 hypothetical protein CH299_28970 [Rhodococcus sp. 14-2686-1-2]